MTEKKTTQLTAEEQAEIESNMPMMLAGITEGKPAALAWLAHWRSKRSIGEEARTHAEEIKQVVAAASQEPEQASLAQWCGFPTDMTRCSPFFPLNVKDLGHRDFLRDFVITSANWGSINYTGPRLSTYEEDALMALFAILDDVSPHRHESEVDGKRTYTYRGPALPLLRLLGYSRPGKDAYKRLISSLELLMSAVVKLSISAGKTKNGRKKAPRYIQLTNMLSGVKWDDEKKELTATINPYFFEMYMAGRVTLVDVAMRVRLKGPISKAMYRFVQSQRGNPVFAGHFLTLADALNMDREQPGFRVRDSLKRAINELIRQGILMKRSGFVDQDVVKLSRAQETLSQQVHRNPKNL